MNIVHIDFTGPFTEGAGYQENLLPIHDVKGGNKVTACVLNTQWLDGKIVEVSEKNKLDYINDGGVRILRFKLKKFVVKKIGDKIRAVRGMRNTLEKLEPDIVFLHCIQTWEVVNICAYMKRNPRVFFVIDSHTDANNSARSIGSRYILHAIYYKFLARLAAKHADKIFYISSECKSFLTKVYHLSTEKMEYLPLGGEVIRKEERQRIRKEKRVQMGVSLKDIVFIHSGKMDKLKKTIDIIDCFIECAPQNAKLLLVGSLVEDIRDKVLTKIKGKDSIIYLGWKSEKELGHLLCMADLYVQPGSQSATAQHALCSGTAVLLANVESYRSIGEYAGWLVSNTKEMKEIFCEIFMHPSILQVKGDQARQLATEYLDYDKQSLRIINYAMGKKELIQ